MASPRFFGPVFCRLSFPCVTLLSWLVLALSRGSDQLFDMGPMSTSTCSAPRTSWTSESDFPGEANTENNPARILALERGHSNLGDMSFCDGACSHSADGGVACSSFWSGTDPGRPGDGGVAWWGQHGRQGPLRACRPDALIWLVPPFRLDGGGFAFLLI